MDNLQDKPDHSLVEEGIYIIKRYLGFSENYYKIKIIELTETSILFEDVDLKSLQRQGISKFKSKYQIMEKFPSLNDHITKLLEKNPDIKTPQQVLNEAATNNMKNWDQESFKKTHKTLHNVIIQAMEKYKQITNE